MKELEVVVPSDSKVVLVPEARRSWKTSPMAPVHVRFTPFGVGVALRVNPLVGGPRAPAVPTKKLETCCALLPSVSVTVTLKSYLPAARPVVLSEVDHAVGSPTVRFDPPGLDGEFGVFG